MDLDINHQSVNKIKAQTKNSREISVILFIGFSCKNWIKKKNKNKNLFRLNTFHCTFYTFFGVTFFFHEFMNSVQCYNNNKDDNWVWVYIQHNITLAYRIAKNPAPLSNVNLNGVVTSRVCRYIYHIYFVCRSAYLTQIYLFIYSKKMKILCTLVYTS